MPEYDKLASGSGGDAYFGQEVLRFHSIAGTILSNFPLDDSSVDERYITHVLARSLIEGFFWVIYIYDDPTKKEARYDELVSSFKLEYSKLYNEKIVPGKDDLEAPDAAWSALKKGLDAKSMMAQVKNDYGDRLDFLYVIYRIASFDTHGKNLNAVFQSAFGKTGNFPALKIRGAFDAIANQYLVILRDLMSAQTPQGAEAV